MFVANMLVPIRDLRCLVRYVLRRNPQGPIRHIRCFARWSILQNGRRELFLSNQKLKTLISRSYANVPQDLCKRQNPCAVGPPACVENPCAIDEGVVEPKVVIIGAGMAGLSAAHRLAQCGFKNFTVLEATDRPGGRIHSCWLGDIVAELGASWIEGACIANPAFTLAAQESLLKARINQPDPSRGLFCTSEGRAVNFPISITAYHTFLTIKDQAAALLRISCERSHGSLLNFMALRIQQELLNFPEEDRDDACRVMYGLLNILRCRCGQDLSLISADKFGTFIEIPGGKIKIPLGYIGILAPLLRSLPDCPISYSRPVRCIAWSDVKNAEPRALIKCCDGSEFPADYVIVTVSLGVLKKCHQSLFSPALPHEKVTAINKLGYGHVNKIYLQYAKPFWVWKEGCLNLAWSPEELLDRNDWMKGIGLIEEVESSQHVLCVNVCGKEAEEVELASDRTVAENITELLKTFTGDRTLPFPSTILRSKWSSDPYFSGAYSYLGLESTVEHQCDLAAPIPDSSISEAPVLLFAGEAAIPGHYSTVHGARISGIREAERIIQLTQRFRGPPNHQPPADSKTPCKKMCKVHT